LNGGPPATENGLSCEEGMYVRAFVDRVDDFAATKGCQMVYLKTKNRLLEGVGVLYVWIFGLF
jgi:hypothetical protein